jgi:glutathione synthase/RimK-type ligase-like ATP-grasp enzyme
MYFGTFAFSERYIMILILSTPRDEHAQTVMAEILKLGAKAQLLDLSEFPQRLGLCMHYENDKRQFSFGCVNSGLDLRNCGSVWWRRPQQPEISPNIIRDSHRYFALNESSEALQGLWHSIDVFWVNDPNRDQVAQRKAYQLCVAQDVGLEIPATLITTCPDAVRDFVSLRGFNRVIYKAFSATETEWRETRLLKENEMDMLENVQYAPVIFQEYIEADADLRVTIVGDEIFAASIYSQETSYKVDFRIDMGNARIEATNLPTDIEDRIRTFMQQLGLVYGAIDMRRTPDGRYVFLEINPAGQWLFIEQHTEQHIASALAQILITHDHS